MKKNRDLKQSIFVNQKIIKWLVFFSLSLIASYLSLKLVNDIIPKYGRYVPEDDLEISFFYGVLTSIILLSSFFFIDIKYRGHIFLLFLIKILVTFGMGFIFESRYPSIDAYKYFSYFKTHQENPLIIGYGTSTIFVLTEWISYLVGHNYYAIKMVFSYMGFIGLYLFWKAFSELTKNHCIKYLYFFQLFPNVLWWSAHLGKEPLILLALGLFTRGAVKFIKEGRGYIWLFIAVVLFFLIRNWLIIIFCLPLIIGYLLQKRKKSPFQLTFIGIFTFFGGSLFTSKFFSRFSLIEFLETADTLSKSWSNNSGVTKVPPINSLLDLLLFIPQGMVAALFRPFIWEAHNAFALLASLENVFILYLFFQLFNFFVKYRKLVDGVAIFLFFSIIFWSIPYGIVSFQNLGTAVRFKMQVIPFIFFLWLYTKYLIKKGYNVI